MWLNKNLPILLLDISKLGLLTFDVTYGNYWKIMLTLVIIIDIMKCKIKQ